VCRVDPEDPKAPDQLSRLTEEQGFHGVRISPGAGVEGDWLRGPLMPPLWKRCAQLKVPMTVLTPVTRLPDLVPLIEQNPELIVVIDHMADCPLDRPDDLKLLTDLAPYPKGLRQNLSPVVDLKAGIPLSRHKRTGQTPPQKLRSQTPDVGN
jgi:hypothetical protein